MAAAAAACAARLARAAVRGRAVQALAPLGVRRLHMAPRAASDKLFVVPFRNSKQARKEGKMRRKGYEDKTQGIRWRTEAEKVSLCCCRSWNVLSQPISFSLSLSLSLSLVSFLSLSLSLSLSFPPFFISWCAQHRDTTENNQQTEFSFTPASLKVGSQCLVASVFPGRSCPISFFPQRIEAVVSNFPAEHKVCRP